MDEIMNSRFNIITVVTHRINCVLEAIFEFMLSQVTKTNRIRVTNLIPIELCNHEHCSYHIFVDWGLICSI